MSRNTRDVTLRTVALVALLGTPIAAGAQQRLEPVRVAAGEAATLHTEAVAVGHDLRKLAKAARLHERSAALRDVADPQAFECTHEAALLRYFSGDRRGAVDLMERAANLAADRGDVVNASRSFSDAAIIAHQLRQGARAWKLGLRAETLIESPLLSEEQREFLRLRNVRLDRRSSGVAVNGAVGAP